MCQKCQNLTSLPPQDPRSWESGLYRTVKIPYFRHFRSTLSICCFDTPVSYFCRYCYDNFCQKFHFCNFLCFCSFLHFWHIREKDTEKAPLKMVFLRFWQLLSLFEQLLQLLCHFYQKSDKNRKNRYKIIKIGQNPDFGTLIRPYLATSTTSISWCQMGQKCEKVKKLKKLKFFNFMQKTTHQYTVNPAVSEMLLLLKSAKNRKNRFFREILKTVIFTISCT